jgi:heme exporter protein C
MGTRILAILGVAGLALLIYNHAAFVEAGEQGFFYIPLAGAATIAALASAAASIAFLKTRNFRFDAIAVAATELGLAFLAAAIVNGCCLTRYAVGKWWVWDTGLTSALACWLLYAAYLMLRQAVEEPSQRAVFAAVWSIIAVLDVPLVAGATSWWKPGVHIPTGWTGSRVVMLASMMLIGVVVGAVRMRQEEARREVDALRRAVHIL